VNAHRARLKALELKAPPSEQPRTIVFLPEEDGAPPDPEVRRKWEEYMATRRAASGVVIYPADVELHRSPDGSTLFVEFVDDWYGNDAHERAKARELIKAPAETVVQLPSLPQIVFDENWNGNNAHQLATERQSE